MDCSLFISSHNSPYPLPKTRCSVFAKFLSAPLAGLPAISTARVAALLAVRTQLFGTARWSACLHSAALAGLGTDAAAWVAAQQAALADGRPAHSAGGHASRLSVCFDACRVSRAKNDGATASLALVEVERVGEGNRKGCREEPKGWKTSHGEFGSMIVDIYQEMRPMWIRMWEALG